MLGFDSTKMFGNMLLKVVPPLLLRALILGVISKVITQDLFFSPSRVAMTYLVKEKILPSRLSRYGWVQDSLDSPSQLSEGNVRGQGVHYLLYRSDPKSITSRKHSIDAIHFNHGFGASSLSWLPCFEPLVDRLHAKVGLAHDAVGFGFSERSSVPFSRGVKRDDALVKYTSFFSSTVGTSLTKNAIEESSMVVSDGVATNNFVDESPQRKKRILLFGHSMGCTTTLRMALNLQPSTECLIFLVSPALLGNPARVKSSPAETAVQKSISRFESKSKISWLLSPYHMACALSRCLFLEVPFQYFLKRLVRSVLRVNLECFS